MDLSNRKNLIILIVADVIVMLMAAGLVISRYSMLSTNPPLSSLPSARINPDNSVPELNAEQEQQAVTAAVRPEPSKNETLAVDKNKRNIKFIYRNSKARQVDIIGDFNGWSPQPLDRGDKFIWSVTIPLEAGEYGYNFVVNGKPVKDPNNPKTVNTGRGFTNSFLKVNPR